MLNPFGLIEVFGVYVARIWMMLVARFRKTCARDGGARDRGRPFVPDRTATLRCERLEDRPKPLREPGFGQRVVRQMGVFHPLDIAGEHEGCCVDCRAGGSQFNGFAR
jgi:hypothetical protein